MSVQTTVHWIVDGDPKCEGLDGSGAEGVEIESPFDQNVLKLTCPYCIARLLAEGHG
jgi:hypothetical protein